VKTLILAALLFVVHYTLRGAGRDITIVAQSSREARRVVQDLFPGAVVTGAARARAR
jgi:hypothetical protein